MCAFYKFYIYKYFLQNANIPDFVHVHCFGLSGLGYFDSTCT